MKRGRDTVLFISAFPYLGGAQVSLATVLRHLPADIHASVAVPAAGPFVDRIREQRPEAELVTIPEMRSNHRLRDRIAIALVLAKWMACNRGRLLALHANGDSELTFVVPVLAIAPRPVFVWHHRAELAPWTAKLGPLWRLMRRRVTWLAVSDTRYAEIVDAGIADARNTVVVPNPIDPEEVVPSTREQHDGFVVGYLGHEYEAKGFTLLPQVARAFRGSGARLLCVVKGSGRVGNPRAVDAALDELEDMPDLVSFAERTIDVASIYARIDAVLVPSRSESFCRVAAEGMANGLPVIGADLPAVRELLHDGAGVLFPKDDGDVAARSIIELAGDPDLAKLLGERGRLRANAFVPSRITEQLVGLYRAQEPDVP